MLADGRPTCGANNCSTNPTSTNICDTATGRCVDCLTDNDCAIETTAKRCDTSLATTGSQAGLPRYACEECLDNSHCPAGATCVGGDCQTPCGTAMCETGEICDAPNNRCIECLSDANCTNNPGNTRCNLAPNSAGLPTGRCEECIDSTHCPTGQVCFDNNCEPACATDAECSTDGGGGSPICHPTIKTCVECAADANCPMTQPFCDMDEYECVQCRTAADCQAGQTCNNQGNCSTVSDGGRGGG
jgi:Cys-rich repeat protein